MAVETGGQRSRPILRSAISRKRVEAQAPIGISLPNRSGDRVPILARQADIQKNDLCIEVLEPGESAFSVVRGTRLVACGRDEERQRFGSIVVIVDDQDASYGEERELRWLIGRARRFAQDARQANYEFASTTGAGAAGIDRAAVLFHQRFQS